MEPCRRSAQLPKRLDLLKRCSLILAFHVAAWTQPGLASISAARGHLGDRYNAAYFSGGTPPQGQSACVDIVVSACRARGLDLRRLVQEDASSGQYRLLRDRDIDHRWAPNLKVWMVRHAQALNPGRDYQPGDLVFWSLTGGGVADHCGVLSDARGLSGKWKVVHQFPPVCSEDDCLGRWPVVGHYRLREY